MQAKSLADYKRLVDQAVDDYCQQLIKNTNKNYSDEATVVAREFCKFISRGGKRIRGSLVIFSYYASGGKNKKAIINVALAVELMHAYILVIDDIQDLSQIRRGGPTLHKAFEQINNTNKVSDKAHIGMSLALNAALVGSHEANRILSEQNFDSKNLLAALKQLNSVMVATSHGQTLDITNQNNSAATEKDVLAVYELKTAHYTIYCPLAIGMILAGKANQTDLLSDFSSHLGKLFQISDDIIGVFGDRQTGKSNIDDIKEGKATLLSVYTAQNLITSDRTRFLKLLGKLNITLKEFQQAQELIIKSGGLKYAKKLAQTEHDQALKSLSQLEKVWSKTDINFLAGLTDQILTRQA